MHESRAIKIPKETQTYILVVQWLNHHQVWKPHKVGSNGRTLVYLELIKNKPHRAMRVGSKTKWLTAIIKVIYESYEAWRIVFSWWMLWGSLGGAWIWWNHLVWLGVVLQQHYSERSLDQGRVLLSVVWSASLNFRWCRATTRSSTTTY